MSKIRKKNNMQTIESNYDRSRNERMYGQSANSVFEISLPEQDRRRCSRRRSDRRRKLEEMNLENQQYNNCARFWTSGSKVEGELIEENSYNDLVANKDKHDIFIIDHGQYEKGFVGKVYLNGLLMEKTFQKKKKTAKIRNYFTPSEYKIIVFTLMHQLIAGDMPTIVRECYGNVKKAEELKELLNNIEANNLSRFQYKYQSNRYVKNISLMNKVLDHHLGVKLSSNDKNIYCFTRNLKFCFLRSSMMPHES
jgi:hypothetical protein